jgi:hypothetical protein
VPPVIQLTGAIGYCVVLAMSECGRSGPHRHGDEPSYGRNGAHDLSLQKVKRYRSPGSKAFAGQAFQSVDQEPKTSGKG